MGGRRKIPDGSAPDAHGVRFEAEGLACLRGGRPVFSDVAFSLAPGDALILSGPNGSGKSSLLRIAAGFLKPVGGVLSWGGAPLAGNWETHRRRLHYVGHLDAVKNALTAMENLAVWARIRGFACARPDMLHALEALDLAMLADVPARLLSAGQRRRLALARLAVTPAPLWLLDEPAAGLDAESTARFLALVARHRAEGGMVLAAAHGGVEMAGAQGLDMARHGFPLPPAGEEASVTGLETW